MHVSYCTGVDGKDRNFVQHLCERLGQGWSIARLENVFEGFLHDVFTRMWV